MAAPEYNASSMQRLKVYRSNENGQWDDQGTGHVRMDYMEQSEEIGLYVIDEDDNATLLVHRISPDIVYAKQEDTIISWRDTESSDELALSFQEAAGCSHVWNHISSMQRILHFNTLNSETFHNVNNDLRELPNVDLSTLPQLLQIVTESAITDERLTELILKDAEFFQKLMAVFENCETMNNVDGLHMMFNIVKGIISLNSAQILEIILGDQLIMKILGCLEYDPNVPQSQHHRNYLREHIVFEAIPIEDPLLLSKIHQTYIIGYLKDVVLTKVLDDATSAKLQSVIDANIATIVTLLKNDNIIQELFARLRSPSTSVESRNNLVGFLHEFCSLSKSLKLTQKLQLFGELIKDGIFDVIAEVLQSPDKKLVLTGTDILSTLLMQDQTILRSYDSQPEIPLLGLLVKGMMEDFGEVFVDLIQNILERGGAQQQRIIMDVLCEKHIPELVDFITASCPEDPGNPSEDASIRVGSHRSATSEVLMNISEFLCFCVRLDPSKKNFFLNNATQKVLLLTRRKEKPIVAAAIRFLRNLLSVRDDGVHNYIVENNTLKPIIDVFIAGGHQDNLLTSAILELLEHISKGKPTVLFRYLVDTFWDQLAPFEHLPSFQALKTKYEKCLESMGPKSTIDPVDMRRNEPVPDEAKPHDSNVVSASSVTPSKRSRGLVDYEDDEDDEEQDQSKRSRLSSTS